jgi:hypothetical protein
LPHFVLFPTVYTASVVFITILRRQFMDQVPEKSARDTHFLVGFSVILGTILTFIAIYVFSQLMVLFNAL